MPNLYLAAGALAVVVVSAVLTKLVRDAAHRRGLLDQPNHRSSHARPTPRTGGVAIAVAAALGWASYLTWVGLSGPALVLAVGALLTSALGLLDDISTLRPAPKFVGQVVLAIPVIWLLPSAFVAWPSWVGASVSVFWIVGYTNALNFMDGSDGLAAGETVIITATLAVFAWAAQPAVSWLSLFLAAAALGFLVFNRPPASIFMGDAGSFFLGFSIATMALLLVAAGVSALALIVLLSPFLFDTSFTLGRRLARGEQVWLAHREHLYQRLLVAGHSHGLVARRYYFWQIVAAVSAGCVQYGSWSVQVAAVGVAAAASISVVLFVNRQERAGILGSASGRFGAHS